MGRKEGHIPNIYYIFGLVSSLRVWGVLGRVMGLVGCKCLGGLMFFGILV